MVCRCGDRLLKFCHKIPAFATVQGSLNIKYEEMKFFVTDRSNKKLCEIFRRGRQNQIRVLCNMQEHLLLSIPIRLTDVYCFCCYLFLSVFVHLLRVRHSESNLPERSHE